MKWLRAALVSLIKAIIYQYFDDDDRLKRQQQWPQQVIWQAKQGVNAFGVLDTMEVVEEEQVAKLMGILEDDGAEKGGEEDDSEDNKGPKDMKQEAQTQS
ncbi:MAG: hypothetical protein Q9181_000325 [Wetmoreana brouardii]